MLLSGRLSVDEVALLLCGSGLGLSVSSSSLHSFVSALMSSTDENGDGQLVWAEFLPVAVDLDGGVHGQGGPAMTVHRPDEFFARLGRDGLIGFGEGYLTGARLLGAEPADCVVVEDAPAGIEAAHAAGMAVIGITTTHERAALMGADAVIEDLRAIDDALAALRDERRR